MEAPDNKNYIDNKEFFEEMKRWKVKYNEAIETDQEVPPVTDYMGECFLKISERLCYRPNFIGYTFRDDFISDGVENCVLYAHNFKPEKSSNPFSYFTTMIYYAFLRRIAKEKKLLHIKHRLIANSGIMDESLDFIDKDNKQYLQKHLAYLKNFFKPEDEETKPGK